MSLTEVVNVVNVAPEVVATPYIPTQLQVDAAIPRHVKSTSSGSGKSEKY